MLISKIQINAFVREENSSINVPNDKKDRSTNAKIKQKKMIKKFVSSVLILVITFSNFIMLLD